MSNDKLRREMETAVLNCDRDYQRLLASIPQCAGNLDAGDGPGVSAFSRDVDGGAR